MNKRIQFLFRGADKLLFFRNAFHISMLLAHKGVHLILSHKVSMKSYFGRSQWHYTWILSGDLIPNLILNSVIFVDVKLSHS